MPGPQKQLITDKCNAEPTRCDNSKERSEQESEVFDISQRQCHMSRYKVFGMFDIFPPHFCHCEGIKCPPRKCDCRLISVQIVPTDCPVENNVRRQTLRFLLEDFKETCVNTNI